MNTQFDTKTRAKNLNRQCINGTSTRPYTTINRLQSKSDFLCFILIKNKGESPPGCSRSSESSLSLHPDINHTASKDNRINNKEEIKYNKSKANFIF